VASRLIYVSFADLGHVRDRSSRATSCGRVSAHAVGGEPPLRQSCSPRNMGPCTRSRTDGLFPLPSAAARQDARVPSKKNPGEGFFPQPTDQPRRRSRPVSVNVETAAFCTRSTSTETRTPLVPVRALLWGRRPWPAREGLLRQGVRHRRPCPPMRANATRTRPCFVTQQTAPVGDEPVPTVGHQLTQRITGRSKKKKKNRYDDVFPKQELIGQVVRPRTGGWRPFLGARTLVVFKKPQQRPTGRSRGLVIGATQTLSIEENARCERTIVANVWARTIDIRVLRQAQKRHPRLSNGPSRVRAFSGGGAGPVAAASGRGGKAARSKSTKSGASPRCCKPAGHALSPLSRRDAGGKATAGPQKPTFLLMGRPVAGKPAAGRRAGCTYGRHEPSTLSGSILAGGRPVARGPAQE